MLLLDLDSVNLDAEEWSDDITCVTSVLKQWLRELPNLLMTREHHEAFLDAARESRSLRASTALPARVDASGMPLSVRVSYRAVEPMPA